MTSKIQRLREQLYLLQGSKCFYCNKSISLEERTLEHLIPSSSGGPTDNSNCVVVCCASNNLLGSTSIKQKMLMLKSGNGIIQCPKNNFEHVNIRTSFSEESESVSDERISNKNKSKKQNFVPRNKNKSKNNKQP